MFDKSKPYNQLPDLPPREDLNTIDIYKATIKASRLLAELKGYCETLPNPRILINTIILQESKDSSAIENIVTTQDDLYKAAMLPMDAADFIQTASKEVLLYKEAIYEGLDLIEKRGLTINTMISIMQRLKNTTAAIRNAPGTRLAKPNSQETIYTPPEGELLIREKLAALEKFIHDDNDQMDPLVKMALLHYQFEAIHPFADGNGRTGRIINVLYLVYKDLLKIPVLYLSSFIIEHKNEYYKLLREVTEKNYWQQWVLYMLEAISETSAFTLQKIKEIQSLKETVITESKQALASSYSRDLVELLFCHPYIKIKTLEQNNIGHRQTASTYLQKLAKANILRPVKIGKEMYYINYRLMNIISKQ